MASEEWKSVPGHGDQFVASSLGRVARVVGHSGANGYQQISFLRSMNPFKGHSQGRKWPEQSRGYAHHLVALAFHGPPPAGITQVNHKDNNRANNRPENLEWVSQRDNILHAWATGRIPRKRLRRISDYQRTQITALRSMGRSYTQIGKAIGVHATTVGYHVRTTLTKAAK